MSASILEEEIYQQPRVLERLLERESERIVQISEQLQGSYQYVVIAARGSSDNAARYGKYLLGARNRQQVALATPSLFTLYASPPRMEGALVIGISQSGQAPDIVAVLQEAQARGQTTLAVTDHPESPLAEAADHTIPLHADEEKAVAATKTYTASLAVLALLSCALAKDDIGLKQIRRLPEWVEQTLELNQGMEAQVERYRYMEHCAVIGRGYNYATCFEIALKIKELTQIVAEPYSSADFMHGPISLVDSGFPLLLTAVRGPVFDDLAALLERVKQKDAEVLLVSEDPNLLQQCDMQMPLPAGMAEWLTPLVAVVPGQLFGLHLARERGLDPDDPPGISKVTETW